MVYFISDLHLGAEYLPDKKEAEQRAVAFLESIRVDATDLYLLGDVLDYWFEYKSVVPRGYIRFFGALARLADAGVKIHWYIGNHDIWLFDYLRDEIGLEIVDGYKIEEILGKKFFLSHGDGVGEMSWKFRFARGMFRNKACQRLYAMLPSSLTVPFAHKWSGGKLPIHGFHSEGFDEFQGIDKDPLARFAQDFLKVDPYINYFIFGHEHVACNVPLSPTCRFVILGDWIRLFTYAAFNGSTLRLHRWH
ncbi:MAG: UDP-2,3-diacylglucosamine diphosphatase [Bacteroidales bacterium]|nr:UDP-2,3-diacylglucosamine diphosphatase [Bacteroidales bacterium]